MRWVTLKPHELDVSTHIISAMKNDDLQFPKGQEDIWELTLFLLKESVLLRSFLEFLRSKEMEPEVKADRLVNWEKYVGFQFGDPEIEADARSMLQTILDAPVEVRQEAIHRVLAHVQSKYLGKL
jgi:hypothetical protein